MSFELTKEQRWEILDNLPENLREVIFSGETSEAITSICQLHDIEDTSVIGKTIGQVLMGLLPPDKISGTIKKRLPVLEESLCNTLAIEIQHYILDPVMNDLMTLYSPEKIEQLDAKDDTVEKEKSERKDVYREEIIE
ncbi:MAG: hypothetical protein WC309_02170 [Candidatus Paceibacterota bacterium]|jgi:hypothetical protein